MYLLSSSKTARRCYLRFALACAFSAAAKGQSSRHTTILGLLAFVGSWYSILLSIEESKRLRELTTQVQKVFRETDNKIFQLQEL